MRWPCPSKNFRKDDRISFEVILLMIPFAPALREAASKAHRRANVQYSVAVRALVATQGVQHFVCVEPLANKKPIQPVELAVVRNRLASAQPFAEGALEQRIGIDAAEHVVQGLTRGVGADAGALDFPFDP